MSTPRQKIAESASERKITEAERRINEHHDFFEEVVGWMKSADDSNAAQKCLPYYDFETYTSTLRLGSKLFHESMLGKTIHENLLSYIVGTGHSYEVEKVTPDGDKEDEITKRAQRAIDEMMTVYEWADLQEEFYNRWFRSGDTVRIVEPYYGIVQFAYTEPHRLGPPDTKQQQNAPFGIEYEGGNVNRPMRYYIYGDDGKASPVERVGSNRIVLHGKRGVDRNDPRGIPLLWLAYCPAREIDELESALSKIMANVSEHSVVYDYNPDVTNASVTRVADGSTRARRKSSQEGKLAANAGGTHHARDYKVLLNGATVNGDDWVRVLQAKRRAVGTIAGLPEFIVTGDADSGTRNTLFVAEAPFTRRVSREARRGAAHEIEVLYAAIAQAFGRFGDEQWMTQFRANYRIKVKYALAESQDKAAETARILAALDKEVISPQIASRMLGEDYEQVQADWDSHLERREQRREQLGSFVALASDDIRVRSEIAQTLIGRGIDPSSALEYVGLDPTEHATLVVPRLPAPTPPTGTPDDQRGGQRQPANDPANAA